jgi:group II intron reverse transcriptase/maturase
MTLALPLWRSGKVYMKTWTERVREVAIGNKSTQFTALFHRLTPETLEKSFNAINPKATPGVDGVTYSDYVKNIEENLKDLCGRAHRGAYRATPSLRKYIPKADGRKRPLGIAAMEDKIVQQAVVDILSPIFEVDFSEYSYGFRPGRNCHDALDELYVSITNRKVSWVLDADIRSYFDIIDHDLLISVLKRRIADPRILRLVKKWLKAGVMEDGVWSDTEVGSPQGAVISPLLANIFLHYVLDEWVQDFKAKARGEVHFVRYADDFVVGFQFRDDAVRFLEALKKRMEEYKLSLHTEKTRLIEFGRFAADNRRRRGDKKPETFDFLGFTHICALARVKRRFKPLRVTIKKRVRAKLQELKEGLKRRINWKISDVGSWLSRALKGYYAYYAVPDNLSTLSRFAFLLGRQS